MPHYGPMEFDRRVDNASLVPEWWDGSVAGVRRIVEGAERADVRELAVTPGGRPVHALFYGEAEPHLRGGANLNSALAAGDPSAFFRKDERQRPVLLLVGGVHGHEIEGVVGLLSVIGVMETGADVRGREQVGMREALDRCRLIVVPLANPDGRARVPYAACIGLPTDEMHRVGQGTRRDGSLWGWPGCKRNHPMVGDVGMPGAYYDDDGINLMHDEWPAPMSPVTGALLRLAREEGPDLAVNLHGHGNNHAYLATGGIAHDEQLASKRFTDDAVSCCAARGVEVRGPGEPNPTASGRRGLNLTSMLYHVGCSLSLTFEVCHGLTDCGPEGITLEGTLDSVNAVFTHAAEWLLARGRDRSSG